MDIAALRDRHPDHWMRATAIRMLAMDAVAAAKSGHSGMPMGMADIATVLWSRHLKFDAAEPGWPDRDRFVVSNGHGSMLLYALLYLTGVPGMTLDEIRNFRQWGAKTAGHPEHEARQRDRGDHRSRWGRGSPPPWAWPSPRRPCGPGSAPGSSITTPTSSPATAA